MMTGEVHSIADVAEQLGLSPMPSVMEQYMKKVREILATGQPVTMIFDGNPVTTFYPDGTCIHHEYTFGGRHK